MIRSALVTRSIQKHTILESLFLRLVFFFPSKCCFPAHLRTIFPRPVTRNRFADAFTADTRAINQNKKQKAANNANQGTHRSYRVSNRTLCVFILYPFFPAATTAMGLEVAGLHARGDAAAGELTASGAPKKDLAGNARLAAEWALAQAEAAASGAERGSVRRARERDIAMASCLCLSRWPPLGLRIR